MTLKIITDSTSDLSETWALDHNVSILGLTVELDGVHYETIGDEKLTSAQLLNNMLEGKQPKTSQVSVGKFSDAFTRAISKGEDVLCITLSSVLSGTYQSAMIAKEMVLEKYPQATINVIDTLGASGGEGYLVVKACQLRDEGLRTEEITKHIQSMVPKLKTYFLVDDLNHLMRGGRLSKTSALIGSIVNIKPIISIAEDGSLFPLIKIRGRKKAIKELIKLANIDQSFEKIILAYNGDVEDVQILEKTLQEISNNLNIMVVPLGPVISAHVGPNTLALFRI